MPDMKDLVSRNFVIVAELNSRRVRRIIEGPDETQMRGHHDAVDRAILGKVTELSARFPAASFDVVVTRAQSFKDLKNAFPEFSGWEQAKSEPLALAEVLQAS
jgi:hypothetical protein